MEAIPGYSSVSFHSPRLIQLLRLLKQSSVLRLQFGTILGGNQPATSCQDDYIGPFQTKPGKDSIHLIGIDRYSILSNERYGFDFLACKASARPTIQNLTYCLIHKHWILHSITTDHGTHFITKVYRPTTMGSTGLIIYHTILKLPANGPMEQPFEDIAKVST